MMRSLIIGSTATLFAVGGAQAADLPLKAKPVEYMKVCSPYGAGFYYIPGSDTCIKVGGYLRAEIAVNTNAVFTGNTNGVAGAHNRLSNSFTWRSRQSVEIDTRTATEYGVVRTNFGTVFSWTSGGYFGLGTSPGATAYDGNNTAGSGSGQTDGGTLGVYYLFIQFAGFTMGKAFSQFSTPWLNYPGNSYDGLVGGSGMVTAVNQFSYTAEFGNGVTGTISAQDASANSQAGVNNISAVGGYGAADYGGTAVPDLIARVRVDQAWGLFQASVVAHDNSAAYYGATEVTGHPADKWGYAAQLALSIKNIPTGPGDTINVQGVYTEGATRYNIQDLATAAGANAVYGRSNIPGVYGSIGVANAPDSVFGLGGSQQLIKTWGGRGAFLHNWSPTWATAVYGAYASIDYNGTATALVCGRVFAVALTNCNPNYNIGQIGLITRWTPVKGLSFHADAVYTMIDQKHVGLLAAGSPFFAKPVTLYEAKDANTLQVLLRAQRGW